MRLSTGEDRSEPLALATIAAAAGAGITVFDTARAYGRDETDLGHNERLLARALRRCGADASARIVTKGGMARPGGAWAPDGRATAIRRDCEASLIALDGLPIDLYLLHAPDPRTPWATSVRALARLVDDGLVRRVGLSNVTRTQLDEAVELAPIAAVQVALSALDDTAVRAGTLARCDELDIALIAHSPLGGPARARRSLGREAALAAVAQRHGAEPAEVALAWLLTLSPHLVAIPGARHPETAHSAALAAGLVLDDSDRAELHRRFGRHRPARSAKHVPTPTDREVVMVMGIPGAGKTRTARELAAEGYLRLNRDERGGSLRDIARDLERALTDHRRVVLDNTYLTRAARSHVIDAAARHGVAVRCVWLDTPLAQAQINLVARLLDRFGHLPTPEDLAEVARREPGLHTPTSQMRARRQLEPPADDEGFVAVEQVPFVRAEPTVGSVAAVFVAASAVGRTGWEDAVAAAHPAAPHLLFDWRPAGSSDDLAEVARRLAVVVAGPVEAVSCAHSGGPPRCWCRPPMPGLPLAFARRHSAAMSRSVLVGTSPAHLTLARALGGAHIGL